MDIKHLKYFVAIVENKCNLTSASQILGVSQPALSKFILDFEECEKVELFNRYNGRLISLTPKGKFFYLSSIELIAKHSKMLQMLRENKTTLKGKVKIGMSPVIIAAIFTNALTKFIIENLNIQLVVIEAEDHELQNMLQLKKIDLAILINPAEIDNIDKIILIEDEISAIVNTKHYFYDKNSITWEDLLPEQLVFLNSNFMIHNMVKNSFKERNMVPNVVHLSSSCDLLLNITSLQKVVCIMPKLISNQNRKLKAISLKPKIKLNISICKLSNIERSKIVEYTMNYFIKFFQ